MIKDVNIIPTKHSRDKASIDAEMNRNDKVEFRGKLEVDGYKNGKHFHHDEGENTVTVWAAHATMHMLTGESFTSWGEQRLFDSDDADAHTATGPGEGTNKDGTLISGQQYFSDNSSPDFDINSRWSKSTVDAQQTLGDQFDSDDSMKYPFFPSKMLFGTGFEFPSWSYIGNNYPDYQQVYIDQGWDQSTFDSQINSEPKNLYSSMWSGSALTRTRSMNDIYTGALTSPVIQDTDFAVPGAIKNGVYESSEVSRHELNDGGSGSGTIRTYDEGGNEFLLKEFAGIGEPCMIYARRESRFFQSGSEIQLSSDADTENKITYTVVMPEQTGTNAGIFYPYNGYVLKVAGLFADAKMLLANTEPTGSGDDHPDEKENYDKMPYGLMFASRYIAPIQKSHDVSISARWTLYI